MSSDIYHNHNHPIIWSYITHTVDKITFSKLRHYSYLQINFGLFSYWNFVEKRILRSKFGCGKRCPYKLKLICHHDSLRYKSANFSKEYHLIKFCLGSTEARHYLEDTGIDGRIILCIAWNGFEMCWLDLSGSEQGLVTGCSEHSNISLACIRGRGISWLADYTVSLSRRTLL